MGSKFGFGLGEKFGLICGVATFLMWGLFPIYFKLLDGVSAVEILAHRILWASVFVFFFILFSGRLGSLKRYLLNKNLVILLSVSGVIISLSWGIYIYAVNSDQILATSLGYFINPLMYMILGTIVFREIPSFLGKIAILIVFIAVAVQVFALGRLPLISLALPTLFAVYGIVKKKLNVPSLESLFLETFLISILALIYIVFLGIKGTGNLCFDLKGALLVLSGLATVLPLITFNLSAQRLKFSTIGLIQYISPTMSTCVAVFIYGEEFGFYKAVSFGLIWLSIAIVTFESYKKSYK